MNRFVMANRGARSAVTILRQAAANRATRV